MKAKEKNQLREENRPIVFITSFPPRKCGIATFAEEAIEFIKKHEKNRQIYVISHTDGRGKNVFPIIDMKKKKWYELVYKKIKELNPYVIHLEHEYALYMYFDKKGIADDDKGFLKLMGLLKDYPTVVELHTVHGRLRGFEEKFLRELEKKSTILIFKCEYQRWRFSWTFSGERSEMPHNIVIIPHGARPDKLSYNRNAKKNLKIKALQEKKVLGLLGWVQPNKKWDIIMSIWPKMHEKIKKKTREDWILFCAGTTRVREHMPIMREYKMELKELQRKKIAYFYDFLPRGEQYYRVMAACDAVALPSLDETQSGTLARIIALGKPYITTAPMEGLTSQTISGEGGLLFCDMKTLIRNLFRLCTSKKLREKLSKNQIKYLNGEVSWDIVAKQYLRTYKIAEKSKRLKKKIFIEDEFYGNNI